MSGKPVKERLTLEPFSDDFSVFQSNTESILRKRLTLQISLRNFRDGENFH